MKLLILDLDETLVHATRTPFERDADFKTERYFVYKRPHVEDFLAFCREHFLVGVWTTGGSRYACEVVDNLFPHDYVLQFLWSRGRCTQVFYPDSTDYYYVKNLAKLKRYGYRLEQMIMVDDTPQKLERQYGNLVQITEWLGERDDRELPLLMKYLMDLKPVDNVRRLEKRQWQKRYAL